MQNSVENGSMQCDISFALRCLQSFSTNCTPMCFLITLLGRWSEAVSLALENGQTALARKIVLKARDKGKMAPSKILPKNRISRQIVTQKSNDFNLKCLSKFRFFFTTFGQQRNFA